MLTATERRTTVALGAAAVLLVASLVLVAVVPLSGLTTDGGSSPLLSAYIWRVARFTLFQAVISTALSAAFALPVALAIARRRAFFGRTLLLRLMAVPLGIPQIVAALAIIEIWGRQGIVNGGLMAAGMENPISIYGLAGILIAHVFFNMPLMTRLLVFELERVPGEYWALAGQLAMPRRSVFSLIEWPAIRRVLPGAAGLVFMLCATSFTVVLLLGGGPAATTLEVAIYQSLRFDFDPPRAMALAALQILITGAILLLLRLAGGMVDEGVTLGAPPRRHDRDSNVLRSLDFLFIAAGAAFLVAPMIALTVAGLRADLARLFSETIVWRAIGTSLVIALGATILSLAMTLMLVRARHAVSLMRRPVPLWARLIAASSGAATSLVLLVPPIVIGAGWFVFLRGRVDPLAVAPYIVVTVNAMMALPFVARILEPAYRTHMARTGRLSLSLGVTGWRRFAIVDWPGLRKAFAVAFAFAMALSLGDLGAIALFGSQDTITLPWLLMSRMGSYRTEDAAGLALILGAVCLILMTFGTRSETARRSRS